MRRTLIQHVLPLVFCTIPVLAAVLIAAAIPSVAMRYYLERVRSTPMDWLILGLGTTLFLVQIFLGWRALQWRGTGFDERPDRWLSNLAQAAEWFPLLGLLGTVAGILQTFQTIPEVGSPTANTIIHMYTPAITATGSGLFMALLNILPTWVVVVGRQLIVALGGGEPVPSGEMPP